MAVAGIQNNSAVGGGLCPHGLPPSACPICSGGMGGGVKRADHTAKAGEMSWNECAAIGAMLRAQKLAKQRNLAMAENRMMQIARFESNMMQVSQKLAQLAVFITNNTPAIIGKSANFIINKTLVPIMNALKDIPANVLKTLDNIKQKIFDIQDKLNAMFGELKNATEKKISDFLRSFKKKIQLLFQVEETTETDDEDKKVDEAKRTFEIKTFINDLYNKISQATNIHPKLRKETIDASKQDNE